MVWSHGHARLPQVVAATAAFACICMAAVAPSTAAQGTTDAGGAGAGAGAAVPSCASKLAQCGGYLQDTAGTPPPSCCGPLKEAATTEAACMCAILMNKAALQAFGVAPEQGMRLAERCGVTTDAATCAKYTSAGAGAGTAGSTAASSASTGSAASTVAKPTASGGTTHRLSLIAASSLVGFSFIWWTILA